MWNKIETNGLEGMINTSKDKMQSKDEVAYLKDQSTGLFHTQLKDLKRLSGDP